jgi:hypothetical protein
LKDSVGRSEVSRASNGEDTASIRSLAASIRAPATPRVPPRDRQARSKRCAVLCVAGWGRGKRQHRKGVGLFGRGRGGWLGR